MTKALSLGTQTQWGNVAMIGVLSGERYYWMVDKHGSVAMMPASTVEPSLRRKPKARTP